MRAVVQGDPDDEGVPQAHVRGGPELDHGGQVEEAVQLARQEEQPSFVRSFAYASGPAYGVLLDECGQKWRPR